MTTLGVFEKIKSRAKSNPIYLVNLGGKLHLKCSREGGCGLLLPVEEFDKGGTKVSGGLGKSYRTACRICRKHLERGKGDIEAAREQAIKSRLAEYHRAVELYGGNFFTYRITVQRVSNPTLRYEGMTGQSPVQRWGQHIFKSHIEDIRDAMAEERLLKEFRACKVMAGSPLFGEMADRVLVHFEVSGAYDTREKALEAEGSNIRRVERYCSEHGEVILNSLGLVLGVF